MPVTPNLGLPYAVGTEFATDYPATVDEPRALMLDAILSARSVFQGKGVNPNSATIVGSTPWTPALGGVMRVNVGAIKLGDIVQSSFATLMGAAGGALQFRAVIVDSNVSSTALQVLTAVDAYSEWYGETGMTGWYGTTSAVSTVTLPEAFIDIQVRNASPNDRLLGSGGYPSTQNVLVFHV